MARARPCATCGAAFTPRAYQVKHGGGTYCSQKCNVASHAVVTSPEAMAKAKATWRRKLDSGEIVPKRGEHHPRWQGGPLAARQRNRPQLRASLLKYRAAHPHKTREWYQNRRGRKTGRLPKGTVAAIYALQRQRCAICTAALRKSYHTDHIVPLARGGKHEKGNIQLLCPTCNVRKSAKDPIEYMQSRGFLL